MTFKGSIALCVACALACVAEFASPLVVQPGAGSGSTALAAVQPITEKIRQKQAIIEATHRKLQASRQKLHAARFKEQTISEQLGAVQSSIARVRNNLDDLASSIDQTQRRLTVRRRQLAWAQASLDRHRDALNHRLVDIYEYGSASYLDVLLSATSFVDFIERWDFLRFVIRSDARLIADVNQAARRYQKMVADLSATQAALEREQQAQERQQQQLGALADERRQLLARAASQRQAIAQQVDELENLSAAEEARLQELIRHRQLEERDAANRARIAAIQARCAAARAAGLPCPVEHLLGG